MNNIYSDENDEKNIHYFRDHKTFFYCEEYIKYFVYINKNTFLIKNVFGETFIDIHNEKTILKRYMLNLNFNFYDYHLFNFIFFKKNILIIFFSRRNIDCVCNTIHILYVDLNNFFYNILDTKIKAHKNLFSCFDGYNVIKKDENNFIIYFFGRKKILKYELNIFVRAKNIIGYVEEKIINFINNIKIINFKSLKHIFIDQLLQLASFEVENKHEKYLLEDYDNIDLTIEKTFEINLKDDFCDEIYYYDDYKICFKLNDNKFYIVDGEKLSVDDKNIQKRLINSLWLSRGKTMFKYKYDQNIFFEDKTKNICYCFYKSYFYIINNLEWSMDNNCKLPIKLKRKIFNIILILSKLKIKKKINF